MGATVSACTSKNASQGAGEASGYTSNSQAGNNNGEGVSEQQRPSRRLSKRSSRIDPESSGCPVFQPPEGLTDSDIELMNGLNCHTAAYVVIDAESLEVKFVSEAFERRTGVPVGQAQNKTAIRLLKETLNVSPEDEKALTTALIARSETVVPLAGKPISGGDDSAQVCSQWFISPLRTLEGNSAYLLCAQEIVADPEVCKTFASRSLAYRLRKANACKQDGEGNWTLFKSYKPLCEIDQMLVDTLQERKEMFCITDPDMYDNPIVYVSDDFISMTGYNRYEINGINCRFLQGHDTSPEDVAVIRTAVKEERHARVCLLNYRKDGNRFINQFNISPLRDAEGKCAYFIGVQIAVEDTEILPFPNTRQSMAEMLVEAEREEMSRSFEQVVV